MERQPMIFGRTANQPIPFRFISEAEKLPYVVSTLEGLKTKLMLDRDIVLAKPFFAPSELADIEQKINEIDIALSKINS